MLDACGAMVSHSRKSLYRQSVKLLLRLHLATHCAPLGYSRTPQKLSARVDCSLIPPNHFSSNFLIVRGLVNADLVCSSMSYEFFFLRGAQLRRVRTVKRSQRTTNLLPAGSNCPRTSKRRPCMFFDVQRIPIFFFARSTNLSREKRKEIAEDYRSVTQSTSKYAMELTSAGYLAER
jgi:hypothetical protein